MGKNVEHMYKEHLVGYLVNWDIESVGVKRLEIICAGFFEEPLGSFKIESDSLAVQIYGLFELGGDYSYGNA